MSNSPKPTDIVLHQKSHALEITYDDGASLTIENTDEPAPVAPPDPLSDEQKTRIRDLMSKVDALLGGTVVGKVVVEVAAD